MICFPFPYVKKFIDRAGTTPTRVGTRPLNNARGDSSLAISLEFKKKWRKDYGLCGENCCEEGSDEKGEGTQPDDMCRLDKVP